MDLNEAQRAQCAPWVERWTRIGLSCEPADWETSERAIAACYGHAGLRWHGVYVRVSNPVQLAWAAPLATLCLERRVPFSALVAAGLPARIAGIAQGPVEEAVQRAGGEALGEAPALDEILAHVRSTWEQYLGGAWWVSWQAFETYCRKVLNVRHKYEQRALDYQAAQVSSGWWAPRAQFVMVCDRPAELHIEQVLRRRRMHCEDGPALRYRDGWALWYWRGVPVPRHAIEAPETITLEEIASCENVEVRRALTERYGLSRWLTDTGAEILAGDMEGARKGAAPRLLMQDAHGDKWLIGTDGGTGRVYAMLAAQNAASPREAHEGLCGFDESRILNKS